MHLCFRMVVLFLMTSNLTILSRFIQAYGTHIIVGMGVGGQDLLCVKQKPSSTVPPAELKAHLDDLGDCLFSDEASPLPEWKAKEGKKKVFYTL